MIRAESSITIDAPIERVWAAMVDAPGYGAWNPFIVRVDAPRPTLAVGDDIVLHVRWEDGGAFASPERVVQVDAPAAQGDVTRAALAYRFTGWIARLGLVRATRVQTLEQPPGGPTRYHTEETFRGALARFVPLARVRAGFARHAEALKVRAESEG